MRRCTGIALALALLAHGASSPAQASEAPRLLLDGFGTIGFARSSEDRADFVGHPFAARGAGHSSRLTPQVDSRLGLQTTAELSPRVSGILQIVSEPRYDGTYRPTVDWANIRFDATPALSVRIGRVMMPLLMTAEYQKVGYATPWIRPPAEVFRLAPVASSDGIDIGYRSHIDHFTNTLRATYGNKDIRVPIANATGSLSTPTTQARDAVTISNALEHGGATFHAAYTRTRLTVDAFGDLFDGYRRFGRDGERIAERFEADNKRVEILNLGARYDTGDWFVLGEWAQLETRSFIRNSRSWYVTAGHRFAAVTPYLTLARTWIREATSHPGLSQQGSQPLDAALNEILGGQPQQRRIAIGTRWDFARNLALTLQYDYLDLGSDSSGVLVNEQPGFERGGSVSVFGAAIDFVF